MLLATRECTGALMAALTKPREPRVDVVNKSIIWAVSKSQKQVLLDGQIGENSPSLWHISDATI